MEHKDKRFEERKTQILDRRSFLKASSAAVVGAAIATPAVAMQSDSDQKQQVPKSMSETQGSVKEGHRRAGWLAI